MGEIYIHTLSYRYYGRRGRKSRTMFPVSYGPFDNAEAAREWIRLKGFTCATKLMSGPAPENIRLSPGEPAGLKPDARAALLDIKTQPARSA